MISDCPQHGFVDHTDPPKLGLKPRCKVCLAREVEKRPDEFKLTPEFLEELKEFRQPKLPFLSLVPDLPKEKL